VSIGPVEPSFWKQLKGAVDYGLSYQQGGDHTQSTLSGSVDYPQEHYLLHLDGSTVFSGQSRGTNTTRYTLDFDYNRYFTRNWYAATMANFLRSSQQDLTARTTLGGGAGHDLVRTDRTNFSGVVGLVYDNEHYSDVSGQPAPTNSLESLLAVNFNTYRFRTTQINSQLAVLPSLTDAGRIRFVSNSYVMLEIVHNLFWKLSVYENYDSRPPTSAPKNDFGVTTSFGWKFGPGR
jgi:putative salt-induced outer membrane protein YdiY